MADVTPRTQQQLDLIVTEAYEQAIRTLVKLSVVGNQDTQLAAAATLLSHVQG